MAPTISSCQSASRTARYVTLRQGGSVWAVIEILIVLGRDKHGEIGVKERSTIEFYWMVALGMDIKIAFRLDIHLFTDKS